MKQNGIYKRIDELGRVVIPINYRRKLGIESSDKVLLQMQDNKLIISPEKIGSNFKSYQIICENIYKYLGGTCVIITFGKIECSYGDKQGVYSKNKQINIAFLNKIDKKSIQFDSVCILNDYLEENPAISFCLNGKFGVNSILLLYIHSNKMFENNSLLLESYATLLSELIRSEYENR